MHPWLVAHRERGTDWNRNSGSRTVNGVPWAFVPVSERVKKIWERSTVSEPVFMMVMVFWSSRASMSIVAVPRAIRKRRLW